MSGYFLGPHADELLDEIYEYTAVHWGEDQTNRHMERLFQYFSEVSVPAEFGVKGYFSKCEHHFVYWNVLKTGAIGLAAILHERMHQIERIRNIINEPL